mmetsp:Transcript_16348/g.34036  ORF Transcript_16348/g.34036 Transcript_16348/m.34036 type:complete len:246 (+) Transcript_16348:335-1072(+)
MLVFLGGHSLWWLWLFFPEEAFRCRVCSSSLPSLPCCWYCWHWHWHYHCRFDVDVDVDVDVDAFAASAATTRSWPSPWPLPPASRIRSCCSSGRPGSPARPVWGFYKSPWSRHWQPCRQSRGSSWRSTPPAARRLRRCGANRLAAAGRRRAGGLDVDVDVDVVDTDRESLLVLALAVGFAAPYADLVVVVVVAGRSRPAGVDVGVDPVADHVPAAVVVAVATRSSRKQPPQRAGPGRPGPSERPG